MHKNFTTNDIKSASEPSDVEKKRRTGGGGPQPIDNVLTEVISNIRAGGAEPVAAVAIGEKNLPVSGRGRTKMDDIVDKQVALIKSQEMAGAADSPRQVRPQGLSFVQPTRPVAARYFLGEFQRYANTLFAVVVKKPREGDPDYAEIKVRIGDRMFREFTCPKCKFRALTASCWKGWWSAQCWKCCGKEPPQRYKWWHIMSLNENGTPDLRNNGDRKRLEERMAMYVPETPATKYALERETDVPAAQRKFSFVGYGKAPRLDMGMRVLGILNCRASAVLILATKKGAPTTPAALGRYLIGEGMTTAAGVVPSAEYARNLSREIIDSGAVERANGPRCDILHGADRWAMAFINDFTYITGHLFDLMSVLWANGHHLRAEQDGFPWNPKEKIPTPYRIRRIRSWLPLLGASFAVKKSTPANKGRGNYWRISFDYVIRYLNERLPPATAPPA